MKSNMKPCHLLRMAFTVIAVATALAVGRFSYGQLGTAMYRVDSTWMERGNMTQQRSEAWMKATSQDHQYQIRLNKTLDELKSLRMQIQDLNQRLLSAKIALAEKEKLFHDFEVEKSVHEATPLGEEEKNREQPPPPETKARSAKEKAKVFLTLMLVGLMIPYGTLFAAAWLKSKDKSVCGNMRQKHSACHTKSPSDSKSVSPLLQSLVAEMFMSTSTKPERFQELEQRVKQMTTLTPELVLNLEGTLTAKQVKKAAHDAYLAFHPDKWMQRSLREQRFTTRVFESALEARDILLARLQAA